MKIRLSQPLLLHSVKKLPKVPNFYINVLFSIMDKRFDRSILLIGNIFSCTQSLQRNQLLFGGVTAQLIGRNVCQCCVG